MNKLDEIRVVWCIEVCKCEIRRPGNLDIVGRWLHLNYATSLLRNRLFASLVLIRPYKKMQPLRIFYAVKMRLGNCRKLTKYDRNKKRMAVSRMYFYLVAFLNHYPCTTPEALLVRMTKEKNKSHEFCIAEVFLLLIESCTRDNGCVWLDFLK